MATRLRKVFLRFPRIFVTIIALALIGAILLFGRLVWSVGQDIPMSRTEVRAFLTVCLGYLPLALIAVFVQGRSESRANLITTLTLGETLRSVDESTERLSASNDDHLARIDSLLAAGSESAAELQAIRDEAAQLRPKLTWTSDALAVIHERLDPLYKSAKSDGRQFVFDVVVAAGAILVALFGLLVPSIGVLTVVLVATVTLTIQLVAVVVGPVVNSLGSRDEITAIVVSAVALVVVYGFAIGCALRVVIV